MGIHGMFMGQSARPPATAPARRPARQSAHPPARRPPTGPPAHPLARPPAPVPGRAACTPLTEVRRRFDFRNFVHTSNRPVGEATFACPTLHATAVFANDNKNWTCVKSSENHNDVEKNSCTCPILSFVNENINCMSTAPCNRCFRR